MRSSFLRGLLAAVFAATFSLGCGSGATSGSGNAEPGHDDSGHHDGGHDEGGDPPVVDPDAGDELARAACHGLHEEATLVEASSDADSARGAVEPGGGTYRIQLPDGGPSFVNLVLPIAHGDWAIFVDHPGVVMSVVSHETSERFAVTPENPNEACPGDMRVDARLHVHTEGHHLLELSADGPREILFQIEAESTHGHGDGPDDVALVVCDLVGQSEPNRIMASSTPEEALAGDVMMTGGDTYLVLLPDGPAYAAVHIPTDHTDWAISLTEAEAVTGLSNPDVGSFAIPPSNPNEACPGLIQVDARVHIDIGGMFVVEFGPEGPDQVIFNMVPDGGHGDDDHEGEDHGDDDHEGDDHEGDDHEGEDHGGHGDDDHGDHGDEDHEGGRAHAGT